MDKKREVHTQPVSNKPSPLQAVEHHLLLEMLEKHNWNKVETAKELGVHHATLYRKMKKYRLLKPFASR
ncbi:MAG: hypothetical protein DWQ10_16410 [Calditrichaeota bacterium]|nr:MAG: hypothetical protein DWQ10_16410 [Calditrichota bacterium]